jgi:crotonobetainyl-CoA:carnitine CoA-transferase CaiB-like acyl-CoA transferase
MDATGSTWNGGRRPRITVGGRVPGGWDDGQRAQRRSPPSSPVSGVLVWLATVVALVLAVLGAVSTLTRRRTGLAHLVTAGVLEAVLLVQAALAGARLAGGQRPEETATFLGYLAGVVLVPVAGVLWSRNEPSRWAGTVIGIAALVTAVMVWRLLQLWEATGG